MPHRKRRWDNHAVNPTARYNLGRSAATASRQTLGRRGAREPHDVGDNVQEGANSRHEGNANFGGTADNTDNNDSNKAKNINLPRTSSRMRGLIEQKNKAMPQHHNLHRQCEPLKLLEFGSDELVNDERDEHGPASPWRLGPSAS